MNALLIAMSRPRRTRRFGSRAGASVIEMALILPLLLLMIFGALSASMVLDRILGVLQVVRYTGSMYARGTDFTSDLNKDLLLQGAGGLGITRTGGTGVIYLSAVVKAAPNTRNAGLLVVAERFVIGNYNSPFPASRFGSLARNLNGAVTNFEGDSHAVATLPAGFGDVEMNERIYVVEVCDSMTDLGGWTSSLTLSQFYARAFF